MLETPTTPHGTNDALIRVAIGIAILLTALATIFAATFFRVSGSGDGQGAAVAEAFYSEVDVVAKAALVYDLKTNAVLYQKKSELQLPLASLTKLMLALVISEVIPEGTQIPITAHALFREGEYGLVQSSYWDVQKLLDFTLIASSNDGAQALADSADSFIRAKHSIPSGENPTVWLMNKRARELGLVQTYFTDPSGLDESESMASAYGSTRDMAQLLSYMILNVPESIGATVQEGYLIEVSSGDIHNAQNTNTALGEIPGLIAGKTGFTDLAGGNLAVVFDVSIGHPVIVVVLGSTKDDRFTDVTTLVKLARESIAK